jgi:hypothetical protein
MGCIVTCGCMITGGTARNCGVNPGEEQEPPEHWPLAVPQTTNKNNEKATAIKFCTIIS